MDIEEDDEDHQMSPEATATSPSSPAAKRPEPAADKEDKHLRKIVHSKSLDDLSPEEDRAKKYESSQVNSTAATGGGLLTSSESFNNFLYWRDPLPILDDLPTENADGDVPSEAEKVETKETEDEEKDSADSSTMELFRPGATNDQRTSFSVFDPNSNGSNTNNNNNNSRASTDSSRPSATSS